MRFFAHYSAVRFLLVAFCGLLSFANSSSGAAAPRTAANWLSHFQKQWNEDGWNGARGSRYMRALDDRGWQIRMAALQGLVSHGKSAVPRLLEVLKTGKTDERILAAQALAFLPDEKSKGPLLHAARNDKSAAVRLYAVDALGVLGKAARGVDWPTLRRRERNGDVRKHIGYAIERKGQPLPAEAIKSLKAADPRLFNSAKLGQLAPDFALKNSGGKVIRLSQFRGKKSVVLVFIYGDT